MSRTTFQSQAARTDVSHEPDDEHLRPSGVRQLVAHPESVRVSDPQRIRAVFSTLAGARATGTVRIIEDQRDSDQELGSLEPVELAPGPRLLIAAGFRDSGCHFPWLVELQGPYSLVRFQLDPAAHLAHGLFMLPVEVECLYRRSERRISAPPGAAIRFAREGSPSLRIERPLLEVGFRGLQFPTQPEDHFFRGERLLAAEVTWKHGSTIPLVAEVRHVSDSDRPGEGLCGVCILPHTAAHADSWQQEISSLFHSSTAEASFAAPEQLWKLYEESGYFELGGRSASEFEHLKAAFANASLKLDRAPELGCRIIREHRGRTEAAMSLLRCWSGAWLLYQGARRQDGNPLALSGSAVLRDMFLHAYEVVQQSAQLRWHVTFIRKDARFSRLSNYEFAVGRIDEQRVSIVPFRAMEVACDKPLVTVTSPNHAIDSAQSEDIRPIVDALAARFPAPYLEAYDFVADRFDLREIQFVWNKSGLARERCVLVARRQGRLQAAAILDFVEPGVHLVGLLDSVHLVTLRPKGTTCFPALLRACQEFYRARGAQKFILFEETGDPSYAASPQVRDLGEANQIFFAASMTPEFLDHICFVTAPRLQGPTQ